MLTFTLAQLAFAADLPPDVKDTAFNWTKLNTNLVVVFDTFRSGDIPSVAMKVVQATQVLYDIPLQNLIEHGKHIIETHHHLGTEITSQELPISGMAKSPSLAFRYNLPAEGKVRRIQLKFTSPQDFDVAYDHVRELGLWLAPNKNSQKAASSGPSCPPSQLSEIMRPLTAEPTPNVLHTQLQGADHLRPLSATPFRLGSTASSRRPESASTLSPFKTSSNFSYSAPLDTPISFAPSASDLPRRKLPFERLDTPNSRGSGPVRSENRPMSSAMGPPPLPMTSRAGPLRPDSKTSSSLATELPPLPMPTYINPNRTDAQVKPGSGRGMTPTTKTGGPQVVLPHNTDNQTLLSSPATLRQLTPRPNSGTTVTGKRPLSAITDTNLNQLQSGISSFAIPPAPDVVHENLPSNLPSSHNGISDQTALENLAAYAKQPSNARMEELNNFVFQHLQDDDFLTLVDDMQMCWARIGSRFQ